MTSELISATVTVAVGQSALIAASMRLVAELLDVASLHRSVPEVVAETDCAVGDVDSRAIAVPNDEMLGADLVGLAVSGAAT